jgi:hypothetical protein
VPQIVEIPQDDRDDLGHAVTIPKTMADRQTVAAMCESITDQGPEAETAG